MSRLDEAVAHATARGGSCLTVGHITAHTQCVWECSKGHQWEAELNNVIRVDGSWCPVCSSETRLIAETVIRYCMEALFDKVFTKARPEWLRNPVSRSLLELDGYCEELQIAFEADGIQHAIRQAQWHTPEQFAALQARDVFKTEECARRGVRLIRIPHTVAGEMPVKQHIVDSAVRLGIVLDAARMRDFLNGLSALSTGIRSRIFTAIPAAQVQWNKLLLRAAEKGYTVLPDQVYTDIYANIRIQCKEGHQVSPQYTDIVHSEKGCAKCAPNYKLSNEALEEEFGGPTGCSPLGDWTESGIRREWICNVKKETFKISLDNLRRWYRSKDETYRTCCQQCSRHPIPRVMADRDEDTTLNLFLTKAKAKYGDKYDYSLVKYLARMEYHVLIICPRHGEFRTTGKRHTSNGKDRRECLKCVDSTS